MLFFVGLKTVLITVFMIVLNIVSNTVINTVSTTVKNTVSHLQNAVPSKVIYCKIKNHVTYSINDRIKYGQ